MPQTNFQTRQVRPGYVRAIPDNVEETRTIPFTISTAGVDRHGTVLNPDGWSLYNYRKNPIVGFMHDVYGSWDQFNADNVIAKNVGIEFDAKDMVGQTKFEPEAINLQAEKIFRKVIFGSLNAASVGFDPVGQGMWGQGSESIGGENPVYYFAGQELLEYSIVTIPSNPDAVKRMRESANAALSYAIRQLSDKFTKGKIEEMRVADVLILLDGKDLEIRNTDPDKVRKMLDEREAIDDLRAVFVAQAEKRNELSELMAYYNQCAEIISEALSHKKTITPDQDADLVLSTRAKLALMAQ